MRKINSYDLELTYSNIDELVRKLAEKEEEFEKRGYCEGPFIKKKDDSGNLILGQIMEGKDHYVLLTPKREEITISHDSIINIADNLINAEGKLTKDERKFFSYIGFNCMEYLIKKLFYANLNPALEKELFISSLKKYGEKMREPLTEEEDYKSPHYEEGIKSVIEYLKEKRRFDENIFKKK